jgi:hypothetical protein
MELAPGLPLVEDLSPARWIESAIPRWPDGPFPAVGGVIPAGFEAYARILHRARRAGGDVGTLRWAELARERGKVMHPAVSFEVLVGGRGPEEAPDWDELVPLEEPSEAEVAELVRLLTPETGTPATAWFALWAGYGSYGPAIDAGDHVLRPGGGRPELRGGARARLAAFHEELERYPLVRTLWSRGDPPSPGREYLLLAGPVEAAQRFRFGVWWQPPNLWWPDDRAWCVATEVDGYDSYVGGTERCIGAVIRSSALEAYRIDPDLVIPAVDPINAAPWDPPA